MEAVNSLVVLTFCECPWHKGGKSRFRVKKQKQKPTGRKRQVPIVDVGLMSAEMAQMW